MSSGGPIREPLTKVVRGLVAQAVRHALRPLSGDDRSAEAAVDGAVRGRHDAVCVELQEGKSLALAHTTAQLQNMLQNLSPPQPIVYAVSSLSQRNDSPTCPAGEHSPLLTHTVSTLTDTHPFAASGEYRALIAHLAGSWARGQGSVRSICGQKRQGGFRHPPH